MAARIPISWLVILALLAVFAFFAYQIVQAAHENKEHESFPPYSPAPSDEVPANPRVIATPTAAVAADAHEETEYAPAVAKPRPVPHSMPHVPGQTEDDLRASEPLVQTPPTTYYDEPEATDPLNRNVFMGSEFGSNLRHPEQMIEHRPGMSMGGAVSSGIAAERSSPGGHNAAGYAPEMAQNGGEFMSGIMAFDTSDSSVAYSMI